MTIRNRELNLRLENLERCAEVSPPDSFQLAKDTVEAIHEISNLALKLVRAAGLKAGNDDRLRNLEVSIYAYILASNPDGGGLIAAEGFGEHVDGPAGERVMANTIRDRDFIRSLKV